MPILYEDTDEAMKHSWDTGSFLLGLTVGGLIFTQVGREMVKTAAGITEEEIKKRLEARKKK